MVFHPIDLEDQPYLGGLYLRRNLQQDGDLITAYKLLVYLEMNLNIVDFPQYHDSQNADFINGIISLLSNNETQAQIFQEFKYSISIVDQDVGLQLFLLNPVVSSLETKRVQVLKVISPSQPSYQPTILLEAQLISNKDTSNRYQTLVMVVIILSAAFVVLGVAASFLYYYLRLKQVLSNTVVPSS